MARGTAGGFIGATLQKLAGQGKKPSMLRVNSEQYDDVKVARLMRRLTKSMRQAALERDALAAAHWSYIVESTLEEMEREAAEAHRLMELRIALLQVQPACRAMLADVRQVVLDARGDQALALLKYAVAWRKVFGAHEANRLQEILDLAAMGAALRNHVGVDGTETIYVATAQDIDGFRWNKRSTQMEPSNQYIGSGYSTGGRHRRETKQPAADVDVRGTPVMRDRTVEAPTFEAEPPPVLTPRQKSAPSPVVEPVRAVEPPAEPVAPPVPPAREIHPGHGAAPSHRPPRPHGPHLQSYPHVSVPHSFALETRRRLAEMADPGAEVPPPVSRPLLRRTSGRTHGLNEDSLRGQSIESPLHRRVTEKGRGHTHVRPLVAPADGAPFLERLTARLADRSAVTAAAPASAPPAPGPLNAPAPTPPAPGPSNAPAPTPPAPDPLTAAVQAAAARHGGPPAVAGPREDVAAAVAEALKGMYQFGPPPPAARRASVAPPAASGTSHLLPQLPSVSGTLFNPTMPAATPAPPPRGVRAKPRHVRGQRTV